MSSIQYSVGKDVLGYCGKCKLVLSHIIVSMKDISTIGKTQCNTCKSSHLFKDPSAAAPKKKRAASRKSSTKSIPLNEIWKDAMATGPSPKAYIMNEKFNVGDLIDHPKFGKGLVERCLENDKIEIVFQFERKVLMHAQRA